MAANPANAIRDERRNQTLRGDDDVYI